MFEQRHLTTKSGIGSYHTKFSKPIAEMDINTREVVKATEGHARSVLTRVAKEKLAADQQAIQALMVQNLAADRIMDLMEALTGEDPHTLEFDLNTGIIYRKQEEKKDE